SGCDARCRSGTALVTVHLDGAAADADELLVTAQLADKPLMTQPFSWHGGASGTLELRFPSGYPSGARVDVQIAARRGGAPLAPRTATATLAPGCSTFDLRVAPGGSGDGGTGGNGNGDGGSNDDGGAGADAGPPPNPCVQPNSDGVECAHTDDPCLRSGVCA